MNAQERFARQRRWFHQLLELAPQARDALLEDIGREDAPMRNELARMLSHVPPGDTQVTRAQPHLPEPENLPGQMTAGTVIAGRYRLLAPLGVGGMGEVYQAQRLDDTAQRVAIKLIRDDAAGNAARFVRERRILAQLQHPHIAHLVDAGVTDTGRPWFALELVEGERITHWCDSRMLDLHARVRLFLNVCEAVQYAHRNLVLHRDLKPSNILVTTEGAPKLLDFGIAKPIADPTDSDPAQLTHTLVFTPAYAAPEQLRGEPVTTLTDTYQLGLILFELCTGVPAHDARESNGNVTNMPRADTAVTRHDAATGERLAKLRGTSRERLVRTLRGDLGRIVAKSLAEDPQERYASAAELADDLACWLHDKPVRAHRGSTGYRLRKFLRRNRLATSAAAIALLALLAGTAGIAWQYGQARLHAEQATQMRDFLLELFGDADPDTRGGEDVSVRDVLDRGAARLEHGQIPAALRAEFSGVLADLYRRLGLYDRGRTLAQARLAQLNATTASHAERHAATLGLARLLTYATELDEADPLLIALETDTTFPARGAQRAELIALRAQWQFQKGDYQASRDSWRQALALRETGSDPVETARAQVRLAAVLTQLDIADESLPLLETAIGTLQAHLGENHSEVARALEELSSTQFLRGDMARARSAAERMLAINTRLFGPTHPTTLMSGTQVAAVLRNQGHMNEAVTRLDAIVPLLEARSGPQAQAHLAEALMQRGTTHMRNNAPDAADADTERAIALFEQNPAKNPTVGAMAYLIKAQRALNQGQREEARMALERARDVVQAAHGIDAARTKNTISQIATIASRPDPETMMRTLREAIQANAQQLGPEHSTVAALRISLSGLLMNLERYDEAIPLLDQGLEVLMRQPMQQNLADLVFAMGIRLRTEVELHLHNRLPEPEILALVPQAMDMLVNNAVMPPASKSESATVLAQVMVMQHRPEEARAALAAARALLPELDEEKAAWVREKTARIESLLD